MYDGEVVKGKWHDDKSMPSANPGALALGKRGVR